MSERNYTSDQDVLARMNDVENTLVGLGVKIEKIYDVVVGNETFDQVGVIGRLKKLEQEMEKLTAIKNKVLGAFLVGGAVWAVVWELIRKLLKLE
jgi:hypothetical protein